MPTQDNTQQETAPEEQSLEQITDAAFAEFAAIADGVEPESDPASIDDVGTDADALADDSADPDDPPQEEPGEEPPAKAADEDSPATPETVDIWEGATEAQRQAVADLRSQFEALEHAERSNRGRVSALQRKIDEFSREQVKRATVPEEADLTDDPNLGLTEAQATELKKDFPDVWAALQANQRAAKARFDRLERTVQSTTNALQSQLDPLQEARHRSVIDGEIAALEKQHPDWQAIQASPDFWGWYNQQDAAIKTIGANATAAATGALLKLYKTDRQLSEAQANVANNPGSAQASAKAEALRKQKLDDMAALENRGPGKAATDLALDEDAAWDKFAKQADASIT